MIINQTASGGKSEGTNRYLVQDATLEQAGSNTEYIYNGSRYTITVYDNIKVGDDSLIYPVGDGTTYNGATLYNMSDAARNNAINNKYQISQNKEVAYKIYKSQKDTYDDNDCTLFWYRQYKVTFTTVKYGVNDDASIYASQTKCQDGYWRING